MSSNKKNNDLRAAMKNKEQKKTAAYAFFGEDQSSNQSNTETEQSNVSDIHHDDTVTSVEDDSPDDFWSEVTNKKPTVEDTHTRGTFLIQNDLLKRLDTLAKGQKRGFKTKLVNYALKDFLDEVEKRANRD